MTFKCLIQLFKVTYFSKQNSIFHVNSYRTNLLLTHLVCKSNIILYIHTCNSYLFVFSYIRKILYMILIFYEKNYISIILSLSKYVTKITTIMIFLVLIVFTANYLEIRWQTATRIYYIVEFFDITKTFHRINLIIIMSYVRPLR